MGAFQSFCTCFMGTFSTVLGSTRFANRTTSIRGLLDLVERHGIVAAIVETGRAGGFVPGHLLHEFQLAAVLQVGGNTNRTKTVVADSCRDARGVGPALDHHVHVWPTSSVPCFDIAKC